MAASQKVDYDGVVQGLRSFYRSGRTLPVEWRKQQLSRMIQMLEERADDFTQALHQDLKKSKSEAVVMEIGFTRNDAVHALNHLDEWAKPMKAAKDLLTMTDDAFIKYEPLGVVLIIGAWNYPVQLTLSPLIGALSAGNCVVLKPSEVSEHTAALLEKLLPQYLDKEAVQVINGGVPETTELLRQKFDHIFYTGNSQVAKVVYEAAAKHLTPVTLELGGKSPVFVDSSSDLHVTARRLMWGKFTNCGQTCIAPDYVLCMPGVQAALVEQCKVALQSFYGEDPKSSDSLPRMVNGRHFNRVKSMLDATKATVAVGGNLDEKSNYIAPTLLTNVSVDDAIMKDEIFGPILPFLEVKTITEAIDFINNREKPLALYIFSKNKQTIDTFLHQTSSGGVCVNDTLMHLSLASLPFGGVGNSGIGSYHGKFSFEAFSHKRGCLVRAQNMEKLLDIRYPPYSDRKLGWIDWLTKKNPKSGKVLTTYFPIVIIGVILGLVIKWFGLFG